MTDTTEKTPAQIAAQIIVDALHDARDNAVTPAEINKFDRAILVAMDSGVLFAQTGEPIVDILDAFYIAMPTPGSRKASIPWDKAREHVYRPQYRIAGLDQPAGAPVVLTDTTTGKQKVWTLAEADNARDVFKNTDSGKGVTRWGVGVRGFDTELAQDVLAKVEKGA